MPIYEYKAYTSGGATQSGVIDADTERDARERDRDTRAVDGMCHVVICLRVTLRGRGHYAVYKKPVPELQKCFLSSNYAARRTGVYVIDMMHIKF